MVDKICKAILPTNLLSDFKQTFTIKKQNGIFETFVYDPHRHNVKITTKEYQNGFLIQVQFQTFLYKLFVYVYNYRFKCKRILTPGLVAKLIGNVTAEWGWNLLIPSFYYEKKCLQKMFNSLKSKSKVINSTPAN